MAAGQPAGSDFPLYTPEGQFLRYTNFDNSPSSQHVHSAVDIGRSRRADPDLWQQDAGTDVGIDARSSLTRTLTPEEDCRTQYQPQPRFALDTTKSGVGEKLTNYSSKQDTVGVNFSSIDGGKFVDIVKSDREPNITSTGESKLSLSEALDLLKSSQHTSPEINDSFTSLPSVLHRSYCGSPLQSLQKGCAHHRSVNSIASDRSSRLDPHTYQSYAAGILYSSRRSDKFLKLQNNFSLLERISELGERTGGGAKKNGITPAQTGNQKQREISGQQDPTGDESFYDELQELYSELNEAQRNKEFFYTASGSRAVMEGEPGRWTPHKEKGLQMCAGVGERTNWYHQALSLSGGERPTSSPSCKPTLVGDAMKRGKSFSDLYNVYDGKSVHVARSSTPTSEKLKDTIKPLDRSLPVKQSYIEIMDKANRNKKLWPIYGTHIASRESSYDKHVTASVKKLRQAFDKDQPPLKPSVSSPDISRSSSVPSRSRRQQVENELPQASTSFCFDANSDYVSQDDICSELHASDPELFVASSLETLPSYTDITQKDHNVSDTTRDTPSRASVDLPRTREKPAPLDSDSGNDTAEGGSLMLDTGSLSGVPVVHADQFRSHQSGSNCTDNTAIEVNHPFAISVHDLPSQKPPSEEDPRVLHVRSASAPHQGKQLAVATEINPLYRTNSSKDTFFGEDVKESSYGLEPTNYEILVTESIPESRNNSLQVVSKQPGLEEMSGQPSHDALKVFRTEKDNSEPLDLSHFLSRTHSKDIYTKHVESAPSRKSSYSDSSNGKPEPPAQKNRSKRGSIDTPRQEPQKQEFNTVETRSRLLSDHSDIRSGETSPVKVASATSRPETSVSQYEDLLAKARKERMARKGYLHSYVNDPDYHGLQVYTATTDVDLRFKNAYPRELDGRSSLETSNLTTVDKPVVDSLSAGTQSRRHDSSDLEDPFSPSSVMKKNYTENSIPAKDDRKDVDQYGSLERQGPGFTSAPGRNIYEEEPTSSIKSWMLYTESTLPSVHSGQFGSSAPVSNDLEMTPYQKKLNLPQNGDPLGFPVSQVSSVRQDVVNTDFEELKQKSSDATVMKRPAYLIKQEAKRKTDTGQPVLGLEIHNNVPLVGNMPDVVQIDSKDDKTTLPYPSRKEDKEGPTVYHADSLSRKPRSYDATDTAAVLKPAVQAKSPSSFKVTDLRSLAKNSEIPLRTFPRMTVPESIIASDFSNQARKDPSQPNDSHIYHNNTGTGLQQAPQPRPFPKIQHTHQKNLFNHPAQSSLTNAHFSAGDKTNFRDMRFLNEVPSSHQQDHRNRRHSGGGPKDHGLRGFGSGLGPHNNRTGMSHPVAERGSAQHDPEDSSPSPTNSSDGSTGTFIVNHSEAGLADSTSSLGHFYTSPTIHSADRAFDLPSNNISSNQSQHGFRSTELNYKSPTHRDNNNSKSLPRNFSLGKNAATGGRGKQSVKDLKNLFEQRSQEPSDSQLYRVKSVPNLAKKDIASTTRARSLPRASTFEVGASKESVKIGKTRDGSVHKHWEGSRFEFSKRNDVAYSSVPGTSFGSRKLATTQSNSAGAGSSTDRPAPRLAQSSAPSVPPPAVARGRYDPYIPPHDIYREVEEARVGRKLDVPRQKFHSPSTAGKMTMEYFDLIGSEWQQGGRGRVMAAPYNTLEDNNGHDQTMGSSSDLGQSQNRLFGNSETDDMKLRGQGRISNSIEASQNSMRNVSSSLSLGSDSRIHQEPVGHLDMDINNRSANSHEKPRPPPLFPRSRFLSSASKDNNVSYQQSRDEDQQTARSSSEQPGGRKISESKSQSELSSRFGVGFGDISRSRSDDPWRGPDIVTSVGVTPSAIQEKVAGKANLVSAWIHDQGKPLPR